MYSRVVFVALIAMALAAPVPWKNCGKAADTLHVDSIEVDHLPVIRGQNLTAHATGDLTALVNSGSKLTVTVKYGFVPVYSQKDADLCQLLQGTGFDCPIQAEHFDRSLTELIPKEAPTGTYHIHVESHDSTGAEIFCGDLDIQIASNDVEMVHDHELIHLINHNPTGWVAEANPRFDGMTLEEVKKLMGTIIPETDVELPVEAPSKTSFDAREQWPKCIHPIRDQAQCGSCWAFGATEALSDRFCIASAGEVDVVLSPQELVACDRSDFGCQGGYLDKAWQFMAKEGVCTEECYPYTSGTGHVDACNKTCTDKSEFKTYKAKNVQAVVGVAAMEEAIKTYGPIEGAFTVYTDFMSYKSGVYKHTTTSVAGGHAIKIIGWGYDSASGQDYWICANSWGKNWGIDGTFWIAKGSNECGIESGNYAGEADLSNLYLF